jgi:hypothetical protein
MSQTDEQKAKTLNQLLDGSKERRKDATEQWQKDFDDYLGKQELQRRSKRRSNTKTNFLFSQIETIKPILTSEAPSISLKPVMDSEVWRVIADEFTKNVNRLYERNDFRARQLELVSNGLFFGHGYYKVTWDSEMFVGNGDIRIEVPDTRSIFLEPGKMLLKDANYVFEVTAVDELTLLRKHPEKAEDIREMFMKAGAKLKSPPTGTSKQVDVGPTASAPGAATSTTTSRFFDIMQSVDIEDPKQIELSEIWFHDDEMMEQMMEIIDPKSGEKRKKKVTKKRFPNGKFIQFAGKVIFLEQGNKFPGIPYVQYRNYFIPSEQYGMTELRQAVAIQRQYNIRNNQLYDHMNFNTGPTRYFDPKSGLDPNMITNAPNQWIPVNDVNGVKTDDPPRLSQAAFESLQKIKQEIETVFGVREVTQGTIPGDIRSGAAIEALQEAADVRLRGKSREMESALRDLTKFVVTMMAKFYVHGVHYKANRTVEGPNGQRIPIQETEEWKEFVDGKKLSGEFFDIQIRAGVNLPRSREARRQALFQLHERGIVDDEYMIEQAQIDGKEAVIERMKPIFEARREAQLAEVEQAAQGVPPGGQQVG